MRHLKIGIVVFIVLLIGKVYVEGGFIDESNFEKVAEHQVGSVEGSEIVHMKKDQDLGVVIYYATYENENEELYLGFYRKMQGDWNRTATSVLDGKWTMDSSGEAWVYTGLVTDPSVEKVYVGDEEAKVFEAKNENRYWYHIEPKGYNYPIKAVHSDGTETWLKEK